MAPAGRKEQDITISFGNVWSEAFFLSFDNIFMEQTISWLWK